REDEAGGNQWLKGETSEVVFQENGLKFKAELVEGQKTGFFLDQRDSRALVGALAKDRTVLNAFSYSGGFAAYALAGGAKRAVSVDASAAALALADENMRMNDLSAHHES